MEQVRLEETLKLLDSEAGSGERRAYLDSDGNIAATPAALYGLAADMVRAANKRPMHYIAGDEVFWAGGVTGVSKAEVLEEPVEVEREAFRKERLGRILYSLGILGLVIFGLLFLYFFFWWYMAQ